MYKKWLLFSTLIVSLVPGIVIGSNGLGNPGFEQGDLGRLNEVTVDEWIAYGSEGWHHNDPNYVKDSKGMKLWWDNTAFYQDFPCVPNSDYQVSVEVIASGEDILSEWDGLCRIEWFDYTDAKVDETEIGRFVGVKYDPCDPNVVITPGDPCETWITLSSEVTAPFAALYGRIICHIENTGSWNDMVGGSLCWDNALVGKDYVAKNPSPEDGANGFPASSLTELVWEKPQPRQAGDTVLCDLYLSTDANFPSGSKILDKQDANSVSVTVQDGTTYYWRVDCYDPNGAGSEIKTCGWRWSFTPGNNPPSVEAGDYQKLWLESGSATATMDTEVTDDGLPDPPGTLTYSWSVVSGTGTPVFSDTSVQNPDVTFDTAGKYELKLTVDDSDLDSNDIVVVNVYNEGYTGLIAHWALDESSGTTAVDSVGGHHGTLVGDPVWLPSGGKVDGAIQLDGDGDYIDCGGGATDHTPPTWADLTEEISISAWIKTTFDTAWNAIVDKGDTSWRLFRWNQTDNACMALNPVEDAISGSTGPVNDNQWHHVVGTYDGQYVKIYVDGILADSGHAIEGTLIDIVDYDVRIGSDAEHFETSPREFNGLIDEVKIYEIGLPADKVLEQFIADGGHNSCGLDYLSGDINEDCYVDFKDFAEIAQQWVNPEVDFEDIAVIVAVWLECNDVAETRCQ
jgi:hypothetical protein